MSQPPIPSSAFSRKRKGELRTHCSRSVLVYEPFVTMILISRLVYFGTDEEEDPSPQRGSNEYQQPLRVVLVAAL